MSRIEKKYRQHAQRLANLHRPKGFRPLATDGLIGPKSRALFGSILGGEWTRPGVNPDPDRIVAAFFQKLAAGELKQDAFWGPNTEAFAESLLAKHLDNELPIRRDEEEGTDKAKGGRAKVKIWSPTDRQMIRHYGQPGSGFVTFKIPFPIRLAWDLGTIVTSVTMHRLAQAATLHALELIAERFSAADRKELHIDRYGGGANVRKKRGGKTFSTHAFGAAMDWDPDRNRLRESKKTARFARPEYKPFLEAWAEAGFMSLGKAYDFDWMHFQLNPPKS